MPKGPIVSHSAPTTTSFPEHMAAWVFELAHSILDIDLRIKHLALEVHAEINPTSLRMQSV